MFTPLGLFVRSQCLYTVYIFSSKGTKLLNILVLFLTCSLCFSATSVHTEIGDVLFHHYNIYSTFLGRKLFVAQKTTTKTYSHWSGSWSQFSKRSVLCESRWCRGSYSPESSPTKPHLGRQINIWNHTAAPSLQNSLKKSCFILQWFQTFFMSRTPKLKPFLHRDCAISLQQKPFSTFLFGFVYLHWPKHRRHNVAPLCDVI